MTKTENAKFHHSALARGYVKNGQEVKEPYKGRYGNGYTIKRNNPQSTQYCIVEYYVY